MDKKGKEYEKCGFVLVPSTIRKHNVKDFLDYNSPEYPEGIYWKEYPRSNIISLNPNDPEDPITLIFNKFDGTMANPKADLFILSEQINHIQRLEAENKRLKVDIEEKEKIILTLAGQYAKWKARYAQLLGTESDKVADILGKALRIKSGGVVQ